MTEKHLKNMALTERMEQLMAQPKPVPSTEQQAPPAEDTQDDEEAYEAFLQRLESAKQKQVAGFEASYGFLDTRLQLLRSATEKAALSGKFPPSSLFDEEVKEEERQFVLTSLAPDCIIEATSKVEWLLSPAKRLEILEALIKDKKIKDALRQPLPKPDRFATQLRRVLASPESLRPDRMNQEDLQALVKVLETLRELDIFKPKREDVEPFLQPGTTLSDYSLLSSNFVGRVNELDKLYAFLESPDVNSWEGFVITGMGGVGKSTLLAKFTSGVMQQRRATVVIIDFDRPGMDTADTGWLETEMARQVGDLYPASRQTLSSISQDLQQRQKAYGSESVRESLHIYKILVDAIGKIIRADDPAGIKPLLLILDTVEEAAQRSLTLPLLNWLYEINDLLNHPLKVIFSGRLYEHQLEEFRASKQVLGIFEIEAFDKNIARKFLRLQGLDRHTAWKLVELEMMPLRPLELKLMARLIGEGSTTLEDLEKDLEGSSGSPASGELFSGLVYRRVLMRIGDPLVRNIAYPGLVLRFVTPEIVREILYPALDLGEIGEEPSEKLVEDLRSYSWLAFERDGALWHSKDLRRTMLRLMILQEPEKVKRIREEAIRYFGNKKEAAAQAEKVYHQLMMMSAPEDGKDLDRQAVESAYEFLQGDMADLPRAAAVLLRYAGTDKVNETDVEFLPDALFLEACDGIGQQLVKNRQFNQAYKIYLRLRRIPAADGSIRKPARFAKWEYELLFSVVDWDCFTIPGFLKENYGDEALAKDDDDYYFLQALIAPAVVYRFMFEQSVLFDIWRRYKGRIKEVMSIPEVITSITRMSYGIASFYKSKEPYTFSDNDFLLWAIDLKNEPAHAKNALILQLLINKKSLYYYKIECSQLKLDARWMDFVNTTFPQVEVPLHVMRRNDLNAAVLLSQIGQSAAGVEKTVLLESLDKETLYDIVRGPDPIFRDPCRYAVLEAFNKENEYHELAGLIQQSISIKLTDLEPEAFAARMMQDAETALEIFIEIIDRSWALGDFLRLLHDKKREAKKIKQVLDVYENWEKCFRRLVLGSEDNRASHSKEQENPFH